VYDKVIATVVGLVLTVTLMGQDSVQEFKEKATKAAEAWLTLVDDARYGESWESSATLVKKAVSKEEWIQSIESARQMFGRVIRRTIRSRQYTTTLPGAPDGDYVIMQYETAFEKKESAVETVTPILDSDGQWRVSGYYIK